MRTPELIERLHQKLTTVRNLDKKLALFGAGSPSGHGYRVHTIVSDQIVAKEVELGFALPEEYRDWLLRVGWGAGPDYGLLSLEKVFAPPYIDDEAGIGGEVENAAEITLAHIAAIQNKWEATGANSALGISVNSDRHLLIISESGCGAYTCIVTHGPMRGKVFGLTSEIVEPQTALCALMPEGVYTWSLKEQGRSDLLVNPHRLFGFFDWYEDWLDRATANFGSTL